jgi:hypothetical protein
MENSKCSEIVSGDGYRCEPSHRCNRNAKIAYNGVMMCGLHASLRQRHDTRKAKQQAIIAQRMADRVKATEEFNQMKKVQEINAKLLGVVRAFVMASYDMASDAIPYASSHDVKVSGWLIREARKALQKAEGK